MRRTLSQSAMMMGTSERPPHAVEKSYGALLRQKSPGGSSADVDQVHHLHRLDRPACVLPGLAAPHLQDVVDHVQEQLAVLPHLAHGGSRSRSSRLGVRAFSQISANARIDVSGVAQLVAHGGQELRLELVRLLQHRVRALQLFTRWPLELGVRLTPGLSGAVVTPGLSKAVVGGAAARHGHRHSNRSRQPLRYLVAVADSLRRRRRRSPASTRPVPRPPGLPDAAA